MMSHRMGGQNNASALPKADSLCNTLSSAPSTQDDLVPVFQPHSPDWGLMAGHQGLEEQRVSPGTRGLQQAATRARGATRNGSGAQQVPRPEVAAAEGVVRNHLGPGEVPAQQGASGFVVPI